MKRFVGLIVLFALAWPVAAVADDAIAIAAFNGETAAVRAQLKAGANPNGTSDGRTALVNAAMGGFVEIVGMLIAAGARLDAEDRNGNTALIWAADRGHAEVARRLLAAGADTNLQNRQGLTALMRAAQRGYVRIARQLVRAKADLGVRDYTGRSALDWAQASRNDRVAQLLRQATG